MASSSFGILFLLTLLTGGASDLLDVIPTNEYWSQKSAQVTPAFIEAELAPPPAAGDISKLIDALGADDNGAREATAQKIRAMGNAVLPQLQTASKNDNPEIAASARRLISEIQNGGKAQQVRKLMAIRTAGEMKMKSLLPRLAELSKSQELFVADYASAAIAAIEGKPYVRSHPDAGDDAWMLPAGTRAVVHLGSGSAKAPVPVDLADLLKKSPGPGTPEERALQAKEMITGIIGVAESLGNVRLDGVTVGISGDIGNRSGSAVFVIRAQYDPVAAGKLLATVVPGKSRAVAGAEVIEMEQTMTLLLLDATHVGAIAGPQGQAQPVDEFVTGFKAGKTPLKEVPEMAQLMATLDLKLPMWGAVHVTDAYRQAPLFASMETVTLAGKPKGDGVEFQFAAKAKNAPAMTEAVAMVNDGIARAKIDIKQSMENMPMPELKQLMQTAAKVIDSIQCKADEKDGTRAAMTGELDVPPLGLIGGLLGGFGMSVQRAEVRENVAPNPPPVQIKP